MATFDHIEDVLGQLPLLKTYTHILLCFPLEDDARQPVLDALQVAARNVTQALPFLAGKVVNEGKGPDSSGIFKVARHTEWESPDYKFVRVEDLSTVCASYKEIRNARGPTSMLPGHLLGARKNFPEQYHETEDDPAPVMDIQANIIRGGLLLDIAAQHNIVDATGIFQIGNLLAICMRGEQIPKPMILEGNRDRRALISLLGKDEPLLDHSDNQGPASFPTLTLDLLRASRWWSIAISADSLARIVAEAQSKPDDFVPSMTMISANDAVTAFLWQRITKMRMGRLGTPNATSMLNRAVDFRRVMHVSNAYLGHMVRLAMLRLSFQEIVDSSLSRLASLLRRQVQEMSNEYALRSYTTFIANEPDKSKIAYGGAFDFTNDMAISSMAHVQLPHFGVLGAPDMLRKPIHGPQPCSTYVSAGANGGLEMLMCLHEEEFALLCKDEDWATYVDFVL
ncbi:hypothetical protein FE257_000082 [Aspergillus nanangensis]|uniref:Trichothecene 3-O-acetyltransferase-like N-terminal domain-containing protein n=1 Tax=Aspergillus nanangensis TaxID=2582783 RepID=A0AAD4GZW9_ASPNN|nr:hypothetical protein FE257_000082 [Aspergillus nanangensis]